ncbi:MAG: hypothetical protein E6356_14005 [Terrisporobacter othiniensis]|nr:hypothetical protein [Terrisporobacter othiniensis]
MKFTDEDLNNYTIMKVSNFKPCAECGEPTQYIDYCYELRVCSKECESKITESIKNTV